MILKNLKYILLLAVIAAFSSCETAPDQEVEHSPIYPVSGEWLTHVYNADGTPAISGIVTLRTYNTSDNVNNKAWFRLGTTQAFAVLGKVDVNVGEKTLSGTAVQNTLKANQTFTINEGKVMLQAIKVPSGSTADSIYVNYTSSFDGKTYYVAGHRRTAWTPTE